MKFEELIIEIKRAHQMGSAPGDSNYKLSGLVSDLVEHIGLHELSKEALGEDILEIVLSHTRSLYHRTIEHMCRASGCNSDRRMKHLKRGITILGIDLRPALKQKPPQTCTYTSPMLA